MTYLETQLGPQNLTIGGSWAPGAPPGSTPGRGSVFQNVLNMLKQNESYTVLGKLHNDLDTTNYTRNTRSRLFFDLECVSNIY